MRAALAMPEDTWEKEKSGGKPFLAEFLSRKRQRRKSYDSPAKA